MIYYEAQVLSIVTGVGLQRGSCNTFCVLRFTMFRCFIQCLGKKDNND